MIGFLRNIDSGKESLTQKNTAFQGLIDIREVLALKDHRSLAKEKPPFASWLSTTNGQQQPVSGHINQAGLHAYRAPKVQGGLAASSDISSLIIPLGLQTYIDQCVAWENPKSTLHIIRGRKQYEQSLHRRG